MWREWAGSEIKAFLLHFGAPREFKATREKQGRRGSNIMLPLFFMKGSVQVESPPATFSLEEEVTFQCNLLACSETVYSKEQAHAHVVQGAEFFWKRTHSRPQQSRELGHNSEGKFWHCPQLSDNTASGKSTGRSRSGQFSKEGHTRSTDPGRTY